MDGLVLQLNGLSIEQIPALVEEGSSTYNDLLDVLFNGEDVKLSCKLISLASSGKDPKFLEKLVRALTGDLESLKKLLRKMEKINDRSCLEQFCLILKSKEPLITQVLKVNRDQLKKDYNDDFQIQLLSILIHQLKSPNNEFLKNVILVLPLLSSPEPTNKYALASVILLQQLAPNETKALLFQYIEDEIETFQTLEDSINILALLNTTYSLFDDSYELVKKHSNTFFNHLTLSQDDLVDLQISPQRQKYLFNLLKFLVISSEHPYIRAMFMKSCYPTILAQFQHISNSHTKMLSALVLTKYGNYTKDNYDPERLLDFLMGSLLQDKHTEEAIEGLVYLSMNVKVKELIRRDVELVDKLFSIYESKEVAHLGILTIFRNLTEPPNGSKGGDQQNQLFDQLSQKLGQQQLQHGYSLTDSTAKDDVSQVESFVDDLLNRNAIHILIMRLKVLSDNPTIYRLISNFCQFKKFWPKLVKEKVLDVLLAYLIRSSIPITYSETDLSIVDPVNIADPATRRCLIQCTLKLLMVADPSSFQAKGGYPPRTFALFLCERLNDGETGLEDLQDEDKFEILISLTNLASMEGDLNSMIVRSSFDRSLIKLLISPNKQIQKLTIELISNLSVSCPQLLEKFFQFDSGNQLHPLNPNFATMVSLADSLELPIQILTMNFFANISQTDPIAMLLGNDDKFTTVLTSFFNDEELLRNEELMIRLTFVLAQIVAVTQESSSPQSSSAIGKFTTPQLKNGVRTLMINFKKNRDIMEYCIFVLKNVPFQ